MAPSAANSSHHEIRKKDPACGECREDHTACKIASGAVKCQRCTELNKPCTQQIYVNGRLVPGPSPAGDPHPNLEQHQSLRQSPAHREQFGLSEDNADLRASRGRANIRREEQPRAAREKSQTGVANSQKRRRDKGSSADSADEEGSYRNTGAGRSRNRWRMFVSPSNSGMTEDPYREAGDGRPDPPHGLTVGKSDIDGPAQRRIHGITIEYPSAEQLDSIIRAGESIIWIWTKAFPETMSDLGKLETELLVMRLKQCVWESLASRKFSNVIKVLLCLALQIQQIPRNSLCIPTFTSQKSLLDYQEYYFSLAERVLSADELPNISLDNVECRMLQLEYYINAGKLEKVWVLICEVLCRARVLRLDRRESPVVPACVRNFWQELWQKERSFSVMLGLPSSIPEGQTELRGRWWDGSDIEKISTSLQEVNWVTRQIIDRDQNRRGENYSSTVRLAENLEACPKGILDRIWSFDSEPNVFAEVMIATLLAKMQYYTVQRLVHLRFLIESFQCEKYEISWKTIQRTSGVIIEIHNRLRNQRKSAFRMCEMFDFQAFAAAMTLVVCLLIRARRSREIGDQKDEHDWQLIRNTADVFRNYASSAGGHSVATQAAEVLDDFSQLQHRAAHGTTEIHIPYFGHIKIQHPNINASPGHSDKKAIPNDKRTAVEGSRVTPDSYFFPCPSVAKAAPGTAEDSLTASLEFSLADGWSWRVDN